MTEVQWELPASSGRERAVWKVVRRENDGFCCDVELRGRYFGELLEAAPQAALPRSDFVLELRGLQLLAVDLQRFADHLREWLQLPLAELRQRSLAVSCGMGGLFDQHLQLELGPRDDTISAGRPVATLGYVVGRLRGELSYVVDPGCLEILERGIRAALGRE